MLDLEKAGKILSDFEKTTTVWSFKHISYEEKIDRAFKELIETDPGKIIKWGWNLWDNILWWIYGWKIYAIWGDSWNGKSTFINQLAFNLSRQWVSITKYSLEDRLEDIGKEDIYYTCNKIRKKQWLPLYSWVKFVNNEYGSKSSKDYDVYFPEVTQKAMDYLKKLKITELDKSKQVKIQDLIRLMEEEVERGTKVFFIDHLHYFKMDEKSRTDLEIQNIMHDINEIARKHNVAIFLVAHYKKLNGTEPDNDSFKDAVSIKQVSNIIIHITREWEDTIFKIDKIRWPIKKQKIRWIFDIDTYTYNNFIIDNI